MSRAQFMLTANTHSYFAGAAAVGGVILSSFSHARTILSGIKGARAKQITEPREELVIEVRASIASRAPRWEKSQAIEPPRGRKTG
jgi:hypothetical protein